MTGSSTVDLDLKNVLSTCYKLSNVFNKSTTQLRLKTKNVDSVLRLT